MTIFVFPFTPLGSSIMGLVGEASGKGQSQKLMANSDSAPQKTYILIYHTPNYVYDICTPTLLGGQLWV